VALLFAQTPCRSGSPHAVLGAVHVVAVLAVFALAGDGAWAATESAASDTTVIAIAIAPSAPRNPLRM
jgi:hypothetical protein